MARPNYPNQQVPSVTVTELSEKIDFMQHVSNWKYTTDPVLVQDRVNWFFRECSEYGVRPTVALLAVALNTSRQNLWIWEQRGGRLGEIIAQAKRILNALLEDWSVCGKINPVAAVWLQKNHFGYRDTINVESTPMHAVSATLTPEEIRRRIEEDIPVDDISEPEAAEIVEGGL